MGRLYVGLDDSNNGRRPLIVSAYFSTDVKDIKMIYRKIPPGMDYRCLRLGYSEVIEIMQKRGSYRFR